MQPDLDDIGGAKELAFAIIIIYGSQNIAPVWERKIFLPVFFYFRREQLCWNLNMPKHWR